MRKASISLLSRLPIRRHKTLFPLLSRDYISGSSSSSSASSSSSSSSPLVSPPTHFNRCTKTHGLFFKSHEFQLNPSRNLDTLSENSTQESSRQRKLKEKSELEEAFESAKTSADMLKAFKEMDSAFNESELGMASLKVGLKLDQEGEHPEMALSFAFRALKVLDKDDRPSLLVAMTLQLIGSANYKLKRFNDSLAYLNRANRMLGRLEGEGISPQDIMPVLYAVQREMSNVKKAMGRREEALENLRKSLEIKETTLGKDSRHLGVAYRGVAEAYVAVLNFKEALTFCLKALEIHTNHLGHNSVEVAQDRRILGVIYSGMEEHEKALEQNELSRKILKSWNISSGLLSAEIDAANMQIALGKFDAAIDTLKDVILQTEKDSQTRALVFITMSKALCSQEKFDESKRCLQYAHGILDKKEEVSPLDVAEMYSEMSTQYETMNEIETAISILKRSQTLLEKLPQEQHTEANVSARIGYLLLLTGKVQEAIPYFESAAESLKECFGPKHYAVGSVYNNLGTAYLELDRPQSAAQMFAVAKDIMEVSLGPHHIDSIEACQNVAKAYAAMGSYSLAIEFQKKVVEAWDSHGPRAEEQFEEAERVLKEFKENALDEVRKRVLPLPEKS